MEEPRVPVSRVLPRTGAGTLTVVEAQAILKVAFLAGEADARVDDAEEDAFMELARALRGLVSDTDPAMADAALDAMIEGFDEKLEASGRDAALAQTVKDLTRPLTRDLAYKVAVAMSVADMDRADAEADFDDQLLAALGLSEEQASLLTEDVYSALER
jgi:tellurite resistance protein